MKIKIFKLTAFVIVIVVALLGFYWIQNQKFKKEESDSEKPLSALTTIDLNQNCKLYVIINPDSIWFEPFENVCSNEKSFSIEKVQYPNLFKQGSANTSFISVEKSNDPNLTLIISNNQPDHGGFSPAYQLIVNPKTGEIKEYKTDIQTFVPNVPSKAIKGSCWTTSLASPLNNKAWRCMTGNFIYDPCFETESGEIVCDSYPTDTSKAFTLDLEKELPDRGENAGRGWRYYSKDDPSQNSDFWVLELENGYKCYAMTSTLPLVNKQAYYYACTGNGETKYAGQVKTSSPVFTTTIVSEKFGGQENVDWSKFQEVKITKVWK